MGDPAPFYSDSAVSLYQGDCLELLPRLEAASIFSGVSVSIITDPVWPGASVKMAGRRDPQGLLASMLAVRPATTRRLALHLGCDSDPRFMEAVPYDLPFFRTCWLDYSHPSYRGRLLYASDVAYLFGAVPRSRKGQHLIPGLCQSDGSRSGRGRETSHPTPRKLHHVQWLVRWWSAPDDIILDPFAGSGTTLLSATRMGRRAVGIEISEAHCEQAVRERLSSPELVFDH